MPKGHRIQGRAFYAQSWADLKAKIKRIVLDYKLECKINIHKSISILASDCINSKEELDLLCGIPYN